MGNLAVSFRKVYGGVKTILGRGKTAKLAETVTETAAKNVNKTVVRPSLPGTTRLERNFGSNLFVSETSTLADGSKKTATMVYGSNGAYIGKGGDQGLAMYRESTVARQKGGSILGGDRVVINKQYNETMAMTAHNQQVVKEYTPEGILEHAETTTKYRHWETPRTSTFDRTQSLSGETAYSQAIKNKKAAEQAAIAEKEAAQAAAKAAEAEAAARLATSRPRVNVGKVLGGVNIDELKVVEKVQPNGGIKRYYFRPETGVGKRQPVITTYDHGSLHQEWIRNGKEDLIYMKRVGNEEPYIVAKNGNITQISYVDRNPDYLEFTNGRHFYHGNRGTVNEQYYNDGLNYARIDSYSGRVERGMVTTKNYEYDDQKELFGEGSELLKPQKQFPITQGWDSLAGYIDESGVVARGILQDIETQAKDKRLNLKKLFMSYNA